jgi:6-phosphogluconate dehydrogenase
MDQNDIGLIGLAVMGQNLVLNMERNGYQVGVYNRTASKTKDFINQRAVEKNITATYAIEDFVACLNIPRRVMLMIKAGPALDAVIDSLIPHLEVGDIVIDGGNSYYKDTERRAVTLDKDGLIYMGVGVSGGEEGALWGPSIMPGGKKEAYPLMEPIFTDISAKVNGQPCVTYLGPRGAGHYVKMVHNGIEYGDMQLIAEAYDFLHRALGLKASELSSIFDEWNSGMLSSYLIEITAEILKRKDDETGNPLVEMILDKAGQKGTGKWTSQDALDIGVPTPTINSAVEARIISAFKSERIRASTILPGTEGEFSGDRDEFVDAVGDALYASKICSYAQGMSLLRAASEELNYDLNYAEIARIWRGGCIIRAAFLDDVQEAFIQEPELPNLLLAPYFCEAVASRQEAWRKIVKQAVSIGIPTPAISASLSYYDSYRSARLPANMIQAQRDYFGAHTYNRIDREGQFHTDWT